MITIGLYFYSINGNSKKQVLSTTVTKKFPFGLTGGCRTVPKFISSLKMRKPSLDSRQQDGSMGLLIRDFAKKDTSWQHKSWEKSGYIGAFDRDKQGHIYVVPMPYVSLLVNKPEEQNQIYRIDSSTAKMSLFMKLPTKTQPNARNPFGAMGLFYDCDTNSLYVSSLAGSQPMKEMGVIYQIDLKTKKIVSKLENTDAIGIGVFNDETGKKLYFGSARNSNLFSIALDNEGHFSGEKRYELSLSQIKGGDSTVIKKVQFAKKNSQFYMILKEIEFGFRLLAENNTHKKKYNFQRDKTSHKWVFKGFSKN